MCVNGTGFHPQDCCYLFGCPAISDQGCYLNLFGSQVVLLYISQHGGEKFLKVGFDNIDQYLLFFIKKPAVLHFFEIGINQIIDVRRHDLLQYFLVGLSFLQEYVQGNIHFLKVPAPHRQFRGPFLDQFLQFFIVIQKLVFQFFTYGDVLEHY